MSQREDRIRETQRARWKQQNERIKAGKVRVPTNEEALAEYAEGMRRSGQDKAAAAVALRDDPNAGKERLRLAERDGMAGQEDPWDQTERFIDRVLADPELEKTLTPLQRIGMGHRLDERKMEAEFAAEEAAANGGT
jgi:hypothetical protein